jgi:hypothetical protein
MNAFRCCVMAQGRRASQTATHCLGRSLGPNAAQRVLTSAGSANFHRDLTRDCPGSCHLCSQGHGPGTRKIFGDGSFSGWAGGGLTERPRRQKRFRFGTGFSGDFWHGLGPDAAERVTSRVWYSLAGLAAYMAPNPEGTSQSSSQTATRKTVIGCWPRAGAAAMARRQTTNHWTS